MYISRLKIGKTLKHKFFMSNPVKLHGIIESCFPDKIKNVDTNPWRIDNLNGEDYIIIVSEKKPDFTNAAKQLCEDKDIPQIKSYDSFLDSLQEGEIYHYRLRANPVFKSPKDEKTDRGFNKKGQIKSIASVNIHNQTEIDNKARPYSIENWLISRSEKSGFKLLTIKDPKTLEEKKSVEVKNIQWSTVRKQGNKEFSFKTADYEGLLEITDKERFTEVLKKGLGREKAYGCGLFTVMKI
jgi:CRISPR system Cascade subunit CasE